MHESIHPVLPACLPDYHKPAHIMATRKRNEWLETENSEDEDDKGYDSEEQEQSRGGALAGRSSKRRKVDSEDDIDSENESGHESEDGLVKRGATADPKGHEEGDARDEEGDAMSKLQGQDDDDEGEEDEEMEEDNAANTDAALRNLKDSKLKPLTAKQLERSIKAAKKTGVIYISRVPPFMKPTTLRQLLSPYGEIGRIFLTPEDPVQHQRRVRAGGNKKKSFTDGWVEFVSKKDAKIVAEMLNSNIIGGKKGNFYHDDVWNIKYLKGFKWQHLTEQIANENAERAARLRAEISNTRRENKKFVENIERAKMLETMHAKKKAKMEREGGESSGSGAAPAARSIDAPSMDDEPRRHFKQNQVKLKQAKDGAKSEQPETAKKVLSMIF